MKKIIYISISLFLMQAFTQEAQAQANIQLSNLDNPTKINVNLLPDKDDLRSLGNPNKGWKDIYMRGIVWKEGSTFLGGYFSNTYLGRSAGYTLLTGVYTDQNNTFIGSNSGFANTTGGFNTFLGSSAGQYNTTGGSNTFVGESAGRDNISGYNNTFLGLQAGTRNTTGSKNIMIGEVAGGFNKTGGNNIYIGSLSGYLNSAGSFNTFVGDSSGSKVTSSYNTIIGSKSGASSTSGNFNTFLGANSALNNTIGSYNTALGYASLIDNASAAGNTALGFATGTSFTNGSYNTFVGYDADASSASLNNSIALGNQSRITASNQVRIGNSSITSIGGFEDWSNISDGRFKKNINENVPGLSFINKLKPVTYNLDVSGIENKLSPVKEKHDEAESATIQKDIAAKEKVLQTGFVAQDVEKVAKEIDYDFSGVDAPKNSNDFYGLRYASFVVPLVKAVQELSKMNDEKDALIAQQEQQITNILKRLQALEKQNGISENTNISAAEGTSLNQNVPNPFNASTVISYSIPKTSRLAKMNIIDEKGRTVKTITLGNTSGKISVNSNELTNGNYFYELIVDGKKSGSRQMAIIK